MSSTGSSVVLYRAYERIVCYVANLSIKSTQSKWSISCKIILALYPEIFLIISLPWRLVYLTVICLDLSTSHSIPGSERHHSLSRTRVSLDDNTTGLIITSSRVSSRSFLVVSRWVMAAILIVLPTCGAASHTPSYARINASKSFPNWRSSLVIDQTGVHTLLSIGLCAHCWSG